ncbi:uncharacterized protein K441DRAFT_660432 [Cenococcum geophilum 1.58]|uniref:uncharacterized protein n=1 Tax=Cenococcum geophilum 1.58 TaxID=794803 RepID=UPI00358FC61C|nr:hypothetical protein K441DRAFT_660432 [Cenococcum geophilum 1.58]
MCSGATVIKDYTDDKGNKKSTSTYEKKDCGQSTCSDSISYESPQSSSDMDIDKNKEPPQSSSDMDIDKNKEPPQSSSDMDIDKNKEPPQSSSDMDIVKDEEPSS